ncbi:symmetrical bis(5'-nucleosyl)-tetraphosphatase [Sessilibacter sp. MAH1]
MPTYVVGDLQGCLDPLICLLEQVNFSVESDQLWLVGDLVNRGPQSLETLRFLYERRHSVTAVLGNHDLHLLAIYYQQREPSRGDTLDEIVAAPDAPQLIRWLRNLPLFYWNEEHGIAMVHAGVHPRWTIQQALSYSREVEQVLQNDVAIIEYLANIYGNSPASWSEELGGYTRLRTIANYFTRMRFCNAKGKLQFSNKGEPEDAPEGFDPWFKHFLEQPTSFPLLFGHWAALKGETGSDKVIGLDTGCVWGEHLTMIRLEDRQRFTCSCKPDQK